MSPKLKDGLLTVPLNDSEFYLGLIENGLYIPRDPYLAIARGLDGTRTCQSLATELALPESMITFFVEELAAYGYVEEVLAMSAPVGVDEEMRRERINIERTAPSWREGSRDGGWNEIDSRRDFSILIFGRSRISRSLLALLQASGFSQSRIVLPPINHDKRVEAKDICGVVTRKIDLGLTLHEHHKIIVQGAQLTPSEDSFPEKPSLIISTTDQADDHYRYLQRWMSEDLAHLQIWQPNPFTIEIGPLVLPGVTPCINCVALHKRDQLPPFISLFESTPHREVTSATSTLVAGVITSYIAEFASTTKSPLRSQSISINVLKPLEGRVEREWDFHPECGCR